VTAADVVSLTDCTAYGWILQRLSVIRRSYSEQVIAVESWAHNLLEMELKRINC
jgi:hypothetical protein